MYSKVLRAIEECLGEHGFKKSARGVFFRYVSVHIQHAIIINVHYRGAYMSASFGFRHIECEKFSIFSIRRFGGKSFKDLKFDTSQSCSMQFDLGFNAGWKPRGLLELSVQNENNAVSAFAQGIESIAIPVFYQIYDEQSLRTVLLSDNVPTEWRKINRAIRIAQILFLEKKLGLNFSIYENPSLIAMIGEDAGTSIDPNTYCLGIISALANGYSAECC